MNNRTKVVLGATVALLVFWILLRVVVLSQAGVSGVGVFYFALPIGGVVAILLLLLRLGLLNFGERPSATVQHWQHNTAARGHQPGGLHALSCQRPDRSCVERQFETHEPPRRRNIHFTQLIFAVRPTWALSAKYSSTARSRSPSDSCAGRSS